MRRSGGKQKANVVGTSGGASGGGGSGGDGSSGHGAGVSDGAGEGGGLKPACGPAVKRPASAAFGGGNAGCDGDGSTGPSGAGGGGGGLWAGRASVDERAAICEPWVEAGLPCRTLDHALPKPLPLLEALLHNDTTDA